MNKLLVWLSVLFVVFFGGRALVQHMSSSANERAATTRVEAFLSGLTEGGDFQAAFNMFETGTSSGIENMTQDQYNMEVARLRSWLASRKFAQPIGSYEILGATLGAPSEGADEAVVVVACTIDGRRAGIVAIRNQPLEWAD